VVRDWAQRLQSRSGNLPNVLDLFALKEIATFCKLLLRLLIIVMVLVIVLHANIEFAKTETFVFGNLSYPMVWANLQNIFRFSSQSDVSQIRPFIHNFTLQKSILQINSSTFCLVGYILTYFLNRMLCL